MPDRTEEKSPLEYALVDGDTGETYKEWGTVYKTPLLYQELHKLRKTPSGIAMRSVVVMARDPKDPSSATRIDPKFLIDPAHTLYHDVQFPRRSGQRGNPHASPSS